MTMRTALVRAALLPLLFIGAALAARADDTVVSASVGVATTSGKRPDLAFAWGRSFDKFAVEGEFAQTAGADSAGQPFLVTLSVMAFGQTPARRNDIQVYGGGGIGFYADDDSGPVTAKILGAGVKVPITG